MRSGRWLIQIIADAETANSADSGQTLLKAYKPAIRGTTGGPSVLRATRIVLRLCGSFGADDDDENSENE